MFCNCCGNNIPEDSKFCPSCGNHMQQKVKPVEEKPAAPVKEKKPADKKKLIPFLAGILAGALVVGLIFGVILLAGGGGNAGSRGKIEGAGFNTAADAAKAYLKAMKAKDVNQMISCFAVESYVENYDSVAQLDRLKSYNPSMEIPIDPSTQMLKALKVTERQANINKILLAQYQTLSGIYEVTGNGLIVIGKEDSPFVDGQAVVDFFTDKDWDSKLAGMKIGKVLVEDYFLRDFNKETFEETQGLYLKTYGCDKLEELAVRVELDGEDYLFFFCAGRYNGKWYLIVPNATLSAVCGVPAAQYGCIKEDEIS